MAGHKTTFQRLTSIAGIAFLGTGIFVLHQEVAGMVARLKLVLGANGSEALGVPPAVVQAVSAALRDSGADHHRLMQGLVQHALLSCWPLVLVMVGTVLSGETFVGRVDTPSEKDGAVVDWKQGGSTNK
jgi:uncharacterized membrane protein YqgA involved in biofilm formation